MLDELVDAALENLELTQKKFNAQRASELDLTRQADVEAKAYEEYKKNPSRLSGDYYRSQRKMTQHMQEHASGR